ncbi:hypothetical protein KM043_016949 [Ampulex compressa]|nr:hypothetical protein KM043_016949 [Ampulex compressa]
MPLLTMVEQTSGGIEASILVSQHGSVHRASQNGRSQMGQARISSFLPLLPGSLSSLFETRKPRYKLRCMAAVAGQQGYLEQKFRELLGRIVVAGTTSNLAATPEKRVEGGARVGSTT